MTEHQIILLNKMIDACIYCGGDPGGPYWTDVGETFEAISDFIHSFPDNNIVFFCFRQYASGYFLHCL